MNNKNLRESPAAAVALIVTRNNPSILLVRRAKNPFDPWSDQWAFPGGRVMETDDDLLATCQREVLEECGCPLKVDQFKTVLSFSLAGRRQKNPVTVAPLLWEIPREIDLDPDPREIASAHWQDLSYLLDPANHRKGRIAPEYEDREFPYILINSTPLWGFTYGVMMEFLEQYRP